MSAAEVRSRLEEIGLNEHKELVRRVRTHCRSRDVAEDSVQEAYVELLLHADEIRSVDSIKAWLIKVENVTDTEELLDAAAYEAFCAQEG